MTEQGDYELDPFEEKGTVDLAEELESERKPKWPLWVALVLLMLALAAGLYWWFVLRAPKEVVPVASKPAPTAPAPKEEAAPEIQLPALDESDAWLRGVVGQLSEHPRLAKWLVNEDLARRFVAMTLNLSEDVDPRTHIGFLKPKGEFRASEQRGKLVADPATFARYDNLAQVIGTLHVDGSAELYQGIEPLLEEAYKELGYPEGGFDAVLGKAIGNLLRTPRLSNLELETFTSSYKYSDPSVEALDEVQKQYLRFGSDNLKLIQDRVRAIAERAGVSVD